MASTVDLTEIPSILTTSDVERLRQIWMEWARLSQMSIGEARTTGHVSRAADCTSWFLGLCESTTVHTHERMAWFCWVMRKLGDAALHDEVIAIYSAAVVRAEAAKLTAAMDKVEAQLNAHDNGSSTTEPQ
jgi:hypothetical protein